MAAAISAGFSDFAIAVLIKQADAPSSIDNAASDGTPIPASTTTGTLACSTIILTASKVFIPCPLPIGDANGITVAQPTSCNRCAKTGSALI
jgi:hypothetical protein